MSERRSKSLDFGASAVAAGEVFASFATSPREYEALEVFRCSGVIAIYRWIVVVVIHGLAAEYGVVAAERGVGCGRPAPADVHSGRVAGKRAAPGHGLDVRRDTSGWDKPRDSCEESGVIEIEWNGGDPHVVHGIEHGRSKRHARINRNLRVGQRLIDADEIIARVSVLKLDARLEEG